MTCIICHGQDIQVAAVREALTIGDNIVYVPIHTPVCHTCGERYYDRRTVRFLEEVQREVQAEKAQVHEVGKVLEYGGAK
jgi:YgiT-type zinc finger domain-containing protein